MINLPISSAVVEALGWTIVHSLWQATLLGGLLWVTSRAINSSTVRYRLAYGTLLSQLVLSVFTFGYVYEPMLASAGGIASEGNLVMLLTEPGTTGWQAAQVLPVVVLIWGLAVIVGTLRLSLSFGRVRRMRREAQIAVPVAFTRLVRSLAERIGLHGNPRVAISSYVTGPALIGHLKPVLLFPVAILNQLTPEQAEAVILHELAHLQRKDHWWNLLQCIIEVLFQYHPMIWWIGARIREEREHCCDDLVLAHGPGGLPYAKALLYFETQRSTPATAVALTNTPGGLLGRMQRFLHQQNIPYQMKSRLFLLPLLGLIALVSTAAYAPADAVDAPVVITDLAPVLSPAPATAAPLNLSNVPEIPPTPRIVPTAIDTLPRGRHKVTSYRNGKSTEFLVEDGEIKSLSIDGKVIPQSEFDDHQPMVESMLGINKRTERKFYLFDGEKMEEDLESFELNLEDSMIDLEGTVIEMEDIFEGFGEAFEGWGESLEGLGETLGRDFEGLFDSGSRVFRFRSNSGDDIFWNMDSLRGENLRFFTDSIQSDGNRIILRGNSRIIQDGDGGWSMEMDREQDDLSEEEKIREMETMIERLERKKAAMKLELEEAKRAVGQERKEAQRELGAAQQELGATQRESAREMRAAQEKSRKLAAIAEAKRVAAVREMEEVSRRKQKEPDFEAIVETLRSEGLIPNKAVTRFKLNNDTLKINGKKMSAEAHDRFMEIYRERYGDTLGKKFGVEYQHKEN